MADLISADVGYNASVLGVPGGTTADYAGVNIAVPTSGPGSRGVVIGITQFGVPPTTASLLERADEIPAFVGPIIPITTDNNEVIKGAIGSTEWCVVCAVRQQTEGDARYFACKHISNGGSGTYNQGNSAVLVFTFH